MKKNVSLASTMLSGMELLLGNIQIAYLVIMNNARAATPLKIKNCTMELAEIYV